MFVDLPGYGFAKVPDRVKKTWGPMVERYLTARPQLKGVVLLLDVRRTPNAEDVRMLEWLNRYGIEPIGVITKADKLSRLRQEKQKAEIEKVLRPHLDKDPILFSAVTGLGKARLWAEVKRIAYPGSVTEAMES
jgi:GTP-binding protein